MYRRGHTAASEGKRIASYRRTIARKQRDPKRRFLNVYRRYATLVHACEAVGISSATFYQWKQTDERFAEAVADCEVRLVERLEQRAIKRAESVSDTLLWRLLQARRPEVYAPAKQVEVDAHLSVTNLTPEAIKNLTDQELAMARHIVRRLRGELGGRPPGRDVRSRLSPSSPVNT